MTQYAYFVQDSNPAKVDRINLDTFAYVDSLTMNAGEAYTTWASGIKDGDFAYFCEHNVTPPLLIKFQISTFTRVASVAITGAVSEGAMAAIDRTNGFIYVLTAATDGNPLVTKVRLSNFSIVSSILNSTGATLEGMGRCYLDQSNGFLYFTAYTDAVASYLFQVNLTTFTIANTVTLAWATYPYIYGLNYDLTTDHIYALTSASPSKVIKFATSDLSYTSLTLATNDNEMQASVIDAYGRALYLANATTGATPERIVKINLDTFTKVSHIQTDDDAGWILDAMIDVPNGYAYFAQVKNPPKIFKIKLSDFTLEDTLAVSTSVGYGTAIPIYDERIYLSVPGGIMSYAPDGCMACCNGDQAMVWGGNEYRTAGFIVWDSALCVIYDYTDKVNNTLDDSGNVAVIYDHYVYLGSTRPIKGVKFYIKTANTVASTVAVSYWYNSAWAAVSTLADGTSVGGITLAQTGSITFDSTVAVAKPKVVNNVFIYWYQFVFTAGLNHATSVYYATVDAPFQDIVDLWDGEPRPIMNFLVSRIGTYIDNTINVLKEDYVTGDELTYSGLNNLQTSEYILCGFAEKMTGIYFGLVTTGVNINATTISVYYWNGAFWTSVGSVDDGTASGNVSFAKSGYVTWDTPSEGLEFKNSISNSELWYYYKINWNATLGGNTCLDYIEGGITTQNIIHGYEYPVMWQNRLWLLNEKARDKNSALCSAQETVCVFNGEDSVKLSFGGEEGLTAGATLFTRFGGSLYDNLIVTKKNEVWLVDGTKVENYTKYKISDNYGCVAPGTMKSCDMGYEMAPGLLKHILVWQAENAIVAFDGNAINPISDDIENYFDESKSECIPKTMIDKSEGFYDSSNYEYHWLFASGSSATTLNKEFVYNLTQKKWFEINRGTGKYIQIGFEGRDADGNNVTFGGIDTGYIEKLEEGTTFDGSDITSRYRIGDVPLADWSFQTKIRKIKHLAVAKTTTTNNVAITHYGDGIITATDAALSVSANSSGKRVAIDNKSVDWGNNVFHSIDCSLTTNDEECGYEPIGLAIMYKVIREDIL